MHVCVLCFARGVATVEDLEHTRRPAVASLGSYLIGC